MVTDASATLLRPQIVHIAQIEIDRSTGMGRVAWTWLRALETRGYRPLHLGPGPPGRPLHPARFPWWARREVARLPREPLAILVHEPAALPFVGPWRARVPTIVFSHGLERRGWEVAKRLAGEPGGEIAFRSRALYPLWRILPSELAVRWAPDLMVLNREDRETALGRYGRSPERTHLYENGVDPVANPRSRSGGDEPVPRSGRPTALVLGSYLPRKGKGILVEAAQRLDRRGVGLSWLLAGTGLDEKRVLAEWPEVLHERVEVIPHFEPSQEAALFARADLFVLPSLFEGQPLSLLQAMAAGRCCIASETCGQRDLLRHGENGLLVPPGDAPALADAVARAIGDPALRTRLGDRARQDVAGRTWEAIGERVADLVEQTIARQRREGSKR